MSDSSNRTIRPILTNRKALHDYEILQRFEAGIVLLGTEVKAIRAGLVSLTDAYAFFPSKKVNDLYLMSAHIQPYAFGNRENHEPTRRRRLLLKEHELHRIRTQVEEKGLTVVPLSMFFSGPYVKVEIGLGRGKKHYDKRASLKEKELKKEARRVQE